MTRVKICGVTTVDDAVLCVEAGADEVGVNLWPGTRRCCEPAVAADIVREISSRARVVLVLVDLSVAEARELRRRTGARWVQLHGNEPPEVVSALLPEAYKALRAVGPEVVALARAHPGERILLDAAVPGRVGGTGRSFDWALATEVARERLLTLAGGLTPDNVSRAIAQVRPHCVDVASGVESAPGRKDPARVRSFVDAVRASG